MTVYIVTFINTTLKLWFILQNIKQCILSIINPLIMSFGEINDDDELKYNTMAVLQIK